METMVWNRITRGYRKLRARGFRLRVVLPVAAVAALAGGLLLAAYIQDLEQYWPNVFVEVGGDLIGAIIIVAILTPLIARAREGRIRERGLLDFDLFADNVAASTSVVKVLDTYSNLLDRPQTPQALTAFEDALARHTRVQILLLHPDSTAALVRAEELHLATVRREILQNVRVLAEFLDRLDPKTARRLEVRLYRAAAAMTLYRWDDRAMISFLSLGRHTSQGNQLEIDVDTSLGHFVEQHFTELWTEAVPLHDYLRLRLRLTDSTEPGHRDFDLPYVWLHDRHYLADPQVLALLARVHAAGGTVEATIVGGPDDPFHLQVVDENETMRETLTSHFQEKYGWPGQAFLFLAPGSPTGQARRPRRS